MKKQQTKKMISIFMCIVLTFLVFGCQTSNKSAFKAGKYTGVGEGIHGNIKVEVEVDAEKILAINVLEHGETPGVSDAAFENVPKEIIDGQTLAVDAVGGATYSSNGIIQAVTEALTAAGGNIEELTKKKDVVEVKKETKELTTDVIVIGAGGAGFSSAISAHENGAEVIMLEKMPKVGGNTIISGAAYNSVDPVRQKAQGIEDSIDKHFTQTYEGGDKVGNPELIRTLVENAYPTLQWLEAMGMEFQPKLYTVLGGLWERAHKPVKPLGTGFIETYMNYIENTNGEVEVMLDTEATELIMEGNKVVGVKAEGIDTLYVIKAKNVVVATGGFGQNIEMRNEYNNIWADLTNIKSTNHPGATGDGITMTKAIGANLIGMEWIQLLPGGDAETGSLSGNIQRSVEQVIFVNKDGKRFVDEGERRDVMTKALFEQKDNFMWIVVDSHTYPTGDTKNNFNETIDDLVAAGRAFKADTIEDLAKQIDVDPATLLKTVEEFNKSVDGSKDEFGRTLFQNKINEGPFYAGSRVPTVHHTMGGIEINKEAQAIDTQGNVIPGLYAAGEVSGGIHGANRLGGNALADINTFGRIAGRNAALK